MSRFLFLLSGCVLSGAALAQTARRPIARSRQNWLRPRRPKGAATTWRHACHARGMRMHPPTCMYDGKGLQQGALWWCAASPVLECAGESFSCAPPPAASAARPAMAALLARRTAVAGMARVSTRPRRRAGRTRAPALTEAGSLAMHPFRSRPAPFGAASPPVQRAGLSGPGARAVGATAEADPRCCRVRR